MKTIEAFNKYLNSPKLSNFVYYPEFCCNHGEWKGAVVHSHMKDEYPSRGYEIRLNLKHFDLSSLTRLMTDLKDIYKACSPGHDDYYDISLNINDGLFVYGQLDYDNLGGRMVHTSPEDVKSFWKRRL